MSTIPSLLNKAVELEKKAQFEYIRDFTASTIAHLMQKGVSTEQASGFAKEACSKHPNVVEKVRQIAILEKAASYIEQLEAQVANLQARVTEEEEQTARPVSEHFQKLANIGFSEEEIRYLDSMPNELVEKVAGAVSEPWQLGKAAGVETGPSDPLLEFILK